ncbi:putative adhesin [Kitasatospora sp. NPDC048540]|uniref:putative adhesin n=1 Tax=unclassified Kitasatospora TaxID=2633591 RepID=UPI0011EA6F13|nr:hypothetical protein [Kitasatospora sp. MBT63]
MKDIFIAGHGILELGAPYNLPAWVEVSYYADAGQILLGANAIAALDSSGKLGSRQTSVGKEDRTVPNYTIEPFTDQEICRVLAGKRKGVKLYIAGYSAPDDPEIGDLKAKGPIAFNFALRQLRKDHPGEDLHVHLLHCRVENLDRHPRDELNPLRTVSFGTEPMEEIDKTARKKKALPEFAPDDQRRIPKRRRKVQKMADTYTSGDPHSALQHLIMSPEAEASQLMSLGARGDLLWDAVTPKGWEEYKASGAKYFADVLKDSSVLYSVTLWEAAQNVQYRNAFYSYLNGPAEGITPEIRAAADLYFYIAPIVARWSITDEEIEEVSRFVEDHIPPPPLPSETLSAWQGLCYLKEYLKVGNFDGMAAIGYEEVTAENAAEAAISLPSEMLSTANEMLTDLYSWSGLQQAWERFPEDVSNALIR